MVKESFLSHQNIFTPQPNMIKASFLSYQNIFTPQPNIVPLVLMREREYCTVPFLTPNNARHFSHMCMAYHQEFSRPSTRTYVLRLPLFSATQLARSNSPVTRGTCMPNFLYLLHACQRSPGYAAADVRTRARACRDLSTPDLRYGTTEIL